MWSSATGGAADHSTSVSEGVLCVGSMDRYVNVPDTATGAVVELRDGRFGCVFARRVGNNSVRGVVGRQGACLRK